MEFRCVYCQQLVPNIRIKCNICPDYDLCLECFSYRAESGNHTSDHDYIPLDDGFHPLFISSEAQDWSASEELSMVDGIEQYGLGNWEAVSCKVRNKSALEVKRHFEQHYVGGSIGEITKNKNRKYNIMDHTGPIEGPLSPTLTVPLPPVNLTKAEAMELGFLPLRDDFEREWDNEAETVLSGAMVQHNDEEVDIAYKLSLVSMYRLRLRERNLRKRIAREYNLMNVYTSSFKKGQPGAKKKSVRDYKEFTEKMRRLTQFITLHEHDRLFHNLQKEKQLKVRIKELIKCRKNGIRTLADAEKYEQEMSKREKAKEIKKEKAKTTNTTHVSQQNEETETNSSTITTRSQLAGCSPTREEVLTPRATPEKKIKPNKLELVDDILTESNAMDAKPLTSPSQNKELLSEREKQLCRQIGMKTTSYVTLKTSILKDYVKRQHGSPVKLRFPSGYDKTHRRTILNFLEQNGWIQLEN